MPITNFMKTITGLGHMTESEQETLASLMTVHELKGKYPILKQGDPCGKIWFLGTGAIRMYRIENKKDITLNLFTKPRFFNDLVAFKEQIPALLNIETVGPSVILEMDAPGLYQLLADSLNSERIVRQLYEQLLYEETTRLHELIFSDATARYNKMMDKMPDIFQRIPQKHIASYLNITPETLCRIRKQDLTASAC